MSLTISLGSCLEAISVHCPYQGETQTEFNGLRELGSRNGSSEMLR